MFSFRPAPISVFLFFFFPHRIQGARKAQAEKAFCQLLCIKGKKRVDIALIGHRAVGKHKKDAEYNSPHIDRKSVV